MMTRPLPATSSLLTACSQFLIRGLDKVQAAVESGRGGALLTARQLEAPWKTRVTDVVCLFLQQLDILCNEEILGKDHTLKFVVVTRWRFKVSRPSVFVFTVKTKYKKSSNGR